MIRNGMDNAQHCRSISVGGLRRLEPETTERDGDEEKVRGHASDSFVVLSYTCSYRAEESIMIIVVSKPIEGHVS